MTPTPGPYRAEGATIKAITHGRWFTVARVDTRQFTPEGSVTNAAHIVRCVNSHDALVAALRHIADGREVTGSYRQFAAAALAALDKPEA